MRPSRPFRLYRSLPVLLVACAPQAVAVTPICPSPPAVAVVDHPAPPPRRSPCERIAGLQEVPFADGSAAPTTVAPYGSIFRVCYTVKGGAVGLIQRGLNLVEVVFEPTRAEDERVAKSLPLNAKRITKFEVFVTEDGPIVQLGGWRDLHTVVLGPRPAPRAAVLVAAILDAPEKAVLSDISWKNSETGGGPLVLKVDLPPLEVTLDESTDRTSNISLTLHLPSLFATPTQSTFEEAIHRACEGETLGGATGINLVDAASCARLRDEPVAKVFKALEARCRTLTATHAAVIANLDRHSPLPPPPKPPAEDDSGLTPYDLLKIQRESSIENDDQRPPHACFAEADRDWDTKIPLRIPVVHVDPAWRELLEQIHPPRM